MTTVIWMNGEIYSDSQVTYRNDITGDIISTYEAKKIYKERNAIYAQAGTLGILFMFLESKRLNMLLIFINLYFLSLIVSVLHLNIDSIIDDTPLLLLCSSVIIILIYLITKCDTFFGSYIQGVVLKWDGRWLTIWNTRRRKWYEIGTGEYVFEKYYTKFHPTSDTRIAIGSGSDYAMEILNKKGSPEEALIYAAKKDTYTNTTIQHMAIPFINRWYDKILKNKSRTDF